MLISRIHPKKQFGKYQVIKSINVIIISIIKFYQLLISPILGINCRFNPSCSEYAVQAFKKFSLFKGFYLTIKRLFKCHPFGKSGYDPIPGEEIAEIKKISVNFLRKMRCKELYLELPNSLSKYAGDYVGSTLHLALYINGMIVSAITIIESNTASYRNSVQIRGMFTKKKYIGMGYGRKLLEHSINLLKNRKYRYVWCNSRKSAIKFYKKHGFKSEGAMFHIKFIGQHQKLYKNL